jgi:2-polyprenyl-6-methoxyphenol hydroxylase-like FAD-dependent oxidoreductase
VAAGTVGSHPLAGLGAGVTLAAVATLAAAIRHAVRHNLLAEGALRPATAAVVQRRMEPWT